MSEPTLYEAAYILDPTLSDEEVEEVIATFEAAVEEAGAEVVATRDFRTRRLAYEIDGFTHGIYKLMYFYATSDEQVAEIRSEMSMRQAMIRVRIFVANPNAMIGGTEEAADVEEPEEVEVEVEEVVEEPAEEEAAEAEAAEAEAAEAEADEAEADEAEADEAEADEAEADEAEADDDASDSDDDAEEAVEADETPETEE